MRTKCLIARLFYFALLLTLCRLVCFRAKFILILLHLACFQAKFVLMLPRLGCFRENLLSHCLAQCVFGQNLCSHAPHGAFPCKISSHIASRGAFCRRASPCFRVFFENSRGYLRKPQKLVLLSPRPRKITIDNLSLPEQIQIWCEKFLASD